ncbi:MAG: hypothetical protein AB2L14_18985 [Candidatus Xenobiia bacterium LiM19]
MRFLTVFLLLFFYVVLPGCHPADEKHVTAHELEYRVCLDSPATGAVRLEMVLQGVRERKLTLLSRAKPAEIQLFELSVLDKNGATIKNYPSIDKKVEVPVNADGTVHLTYIAKPGGMGRHGHQGYICADFAVFDGRVFLEPERADSISNVALQINGPAGWQVVTPFEKKGDFYDPSIYGKDMQFKALQKSYIAFGKFHCEERRIGITPMYVYTYREWAPSHRRKIADKAFHLFSFFQKIFSSSFPTPYVICFIPKAADGGKIFGGVWSGGQCYEMPDDAARNWELFAHRIAHVYNEYEPYGMDFQKIEDSWLVEAWACYAEMSSTGETGICDSTVTWERLYSEYLLRVSQNAALYDVPMAKQYLVSNEDIIEFVHYTKAPLAALLLDFRIRMATDDGRNLNGFIAFLYHKYGYHKGKIDLINELRAYTGEDFSSFLGLNIEMPGIMLPLWRLNPLGGSAEPEGKVICTVSGRPVHEAELYRYLRVYGKSLSELDEVKEMIRRDGVIDEVFTREGIAFPPVINAAHVEMMDDRSWRLYMEKKREVFRNHLETEYYKKDSGSTDEKQMVMPILEEWRSRLHAGKDAPPLKSDYIESVYIGKKRDHSIIYDESAVFSAGEKVEAVIRLKKRECCRLSVLWKAPDGRKVRERRFSTHKDWNMTWDTLPSGKCTAPGIWEFGVAADGAGEVSVPFLVVPHLQASVK